MPVADWRVVTAAKTKRVPDAVTQAGIIYHYQGQLVGDYDKCENADEVMGMLEGAK